MKGSFEINLKQHSPLLHYQGMQSGAFLSDAALKAAIDEQMGNLLSGNRKPITYSLYSRLTGKIDRELYDNKMVNNKLYFGDIGITNPQQKTYMINTTCPIKLFIGDYAFHFEELYQYMPSFKDYFVENLRKTLAFNNFGKRSNKGFGCFWLGEGITLEGYLKSTLPDLYKFTIKLSGNIDIWNLYKECYDQIDLVYRKLKSGINLPGRFYTKSLLFEYLNSKGMEWDKKSIKEIILNGKKYSKNPFMYRFLLGYAQEHNYKPKKKTNFGSAHTGFIVKYSIKEKGVTNTNITRIPSPIMFKIVYKNINEADILIFVNPWVTSPEYGRLANTQIQAHTVYNGKHYNITFDMAKIDLNDFLKYAFGPRWKQSLPGSCSDPVGMKLNSINITKVI